MIMEGINGAFDLEVGMNPPRVAHPKSIQSTITVTKAIWHFVVALFGGVSFLKIESGAEAQLQSSLMEKATMDVDALMENMGSSVSGLTMQQANELLKKFGPNILPAQKSNQWQKILWNATWHPFNLILFTLAVVSGVTSDMATFTLMCAMITLSVGLRFQQEFKTSKEASKLALMIEARATVFRDDNILGKNVKLEVKQSEVVPGDIVFLRVGDLLPGDVRILTSKELLVSQSSLTGESMPIEKVSSVPHFHDATLLELGNICFMGTSIVSGEGTGVVLSTGSRTYIGTVAAVLRGETPTNAFQNGIRRVSFLLVSFMFAMVPLVIVISGLTTKSWSESFLFGISVAVGLTPEMLPMIVNANLACGALEMARRKCIVKRVDAVQNMGAMDILCTDKTGTLTLDNVAMVQYFDRYGTAKHQVYKYAYMNSFFQNALKNPIDKAILAFSENHHERIDVSKWERIDEIPFDFERRILSVLLGELNDMAQEGKDSEVVHLHCKKLLVTKGALEEMLSICTSAQDGEDGNDVTPMTSELLDALLKMGQGLNSDGLRVLVVATKHIAVQHHTTRIEQADNGMASSENKVTVDEEKDMVFQGFLAFSDPPKASAKEAICSLMKAGVAIKVLTGDNLPVAIKICRDMGIAADHVVTGSELAAQTQGAFYTTVKKATILAKLTPIQKLEVVQALKVENHVVGFLGDGLNDVLALKGADVGMTVDSATSVAKDAAEIILLEKDLNVLMAGVTCGRITHGNTIKYIKMAASSNFGNVFSILVASAWLPFNPMRPVQILTQNLLYDISQVSIPWDRMDCGYTDKPRQWSAKGIARFMICMGPVSSIIDIATFSLMWWYYGVRTEERQALLQSAWFVEGLLSQILVIHTLRTARVPFVQEMASKVVMIVTSLVVVLGVCVPFTPLGKVEKMMHLPASYFGFLVVILLSYCCLAQLVKMLYIKVFKSWL